MRSLRTILVVILLIALLLLLLRSRLPLLARTDVAGGLPLDLTEMIPANWQPLPQQYYQCDFDGDGERERLVFYRYDTTTVGAPFVENAVERSAIGGVIFDSQVNLAPQEPDNTSPYRPAFLTPYRLLPDIFPGKGQGYLGETSIRPAFSPPIPANATGNGADGGATCSVSEITVLGYSESPLPTRLSIFRWMGEDEGYLSRHFVGNAQVTVNNPLDLGQPVQEVITYNRLNHRSRLCEQQAFQRQGAPEALQFVEDPGRYTIDFCYNAPRDPAYPEGVVVALLRGYNPDVTLVTPTGGNFLTDEAMTSLPPDLAPLQNAERRPYQILSLSNPGTLPGYPAAGSVLTDTNNIRWVWGRERVEIRTGIVLSTGEREAVWHVASMANERVLAETHWRIESVTLP